MHPLWAWKIENFFQKYPKQGSSACWNSGQDKRSIKQIKKEQKKGHIRSSRIRNKKKEIQKKENMCQALRFVNIFSKIKVQSAINEFNDSIKIFGLKRRAK